MARSAPRHTQSKRERRCGSVVSLRSLCENKLRGLRVLYVRINPQSSLRVKILALSFREM